MKRRIIIIIPLLIIGVLIVYLSSAKWYNVIGWEAHYSKDTYLEGGEGNLYYDENFRIHYQYIVNSGGARFELKDEDGKIVYEMDVTESCEGYIYFDDIGKGNYYDHGYALDDTSDVYCVGNVQLKRSNLTMFLNNINKHSGYKLFGEDFLKVD